MQKNLLKKCVRVSNPQRLFNSKNWYLAIDIKAFWYAHTFKSIGKTLKKAAKKLQKGSKKGSKKGCKSLQKAPIRLH